MSGILHTYIPNRVIDSNGIADGSSLAFYATGTLTPAAIYSDSGLTTPLANPVVVGAGAAVPSFYLDSTVTYRRKITDSDGNTISDDDPYTGIDSSGISGLAKLARSPQYDDGATADGTTVDNVALAASLAAKKLVQLDGNLAITTTHDVAYDQSLKGFARSGELTIPASHSLTLNTVLRANVNAGETAWVHEFPAKVATVIEGFKIDAVAARAAAKKIKGIVLGGSTTFRNMSFDGVVCAFKQVNNYCDQVTVDGVYVNDPAEQTSGEYLLDLGANVGDGGFVNSLSTTYAIADSDGTKRKTVNVIQAVQRGGGVIQNTINGNVFVWNCRGMDLNAGHHEFGGYELKDSVASLRNMMLWKRTNDSTYLDVEREPIIFSTGGVSSFVGMYILDNITINYFPIEWGYPTDVYDIKTAANLKATTHLRNVVRAIGSDSGALGDATYIGVNMWDGTNPVYAFNNYSHLASRRCEIINGAVHLDHSVSSLTAGAGIAALATSSKRVWAGGTGTLYVKVAYYYDTFRKAGTIGTSEMSLALTDGGNCARIQILPPNTMLGLMARVYLGMPTGGGTGSYNYYVDVPVTTGFQLYFDGVDIAGYPIVARVAGAADTLNAHLLGGFELKPGDNGNAAYGVATMRTTSTSALIPTVGSFKAGDTVIGPHATMRYNGSGWSVISGETYSNANIGDAALDISALRYAEYDIGATTVITAHRTVTIPLPADVPGTKITVARSATATGAFNIVISDGTTTWGTLTGTGTFKLASFGGSWVAVRTS
jgi:hypothetical protein